MRTLAISGPRPLTKLQPDGGIAGPLHRVVLTEAHMKAQVTEDAAGLHFEIKDDGSAEYKKAAQLTREANGREERGRAAMVDFGALYARERRFDTKSASVGDLLDRIKRFIDRTDPWTSQTVDRDYKINTPESRNARKAIAELCKRLAGLT